MPRYVSIARHLAQFIIDVGIWRTTIECKQMEPVHIPSRRYLLVRGSMHALIRDFPHPCPKLAVQIVEPARFASLQSAQEVPAHILHPRFHFALGLRAIRP